MKLVSTHKRVAQSSSRVERIDRAGASLQALVASQKYDEIAVAFEPADKIFWCFQQPRAAPSYTPALLADLGRMQRSIKTLYTRFAAFEPRPIHYFVGGSRPPEIFNLGGDLQLLGELISAGDRAGLQRYARACIELVYNNAVNYGLPIVTVALVQGDALGGGFESALSCNVIIAERRAKCGFPEVLFNLFPGMGAYSLLARRLNAAQAERMIMSGKLYTAEELHQMGLVDILAEDGEGEEAVRAFIRGEKRRRAQRSIYRVRNRVHPLSLAELLDVGRIWVDAALQLNDADLRKMRRLTTAQLRRQTGDLMGQGLESSTIAVRAGRKVG